MNRLFSRASRPALVAALALSVVSPTEARLSVVATTPDLGAIAGAIGGNEVSVLSLAKPTEDPHFVDARPSHIVTLNRAHALIEGGAELESGWLPPLIAGARNARVQPGAPGRIAAASGVTLLDIPNALDRSRGDIHAAGNPHFMMDPLNASIVARHISESFCALDPQQCSVYRSNLSDFEARLASGIKEWTSMLAPHKGSAITTYHATWRYFAKRFELDCSTFLEPKPGIPPSPPHLASIIAKMKSEKITAILLEPYQSRRVAESVAARTGAKVVNVAQFPGGLPGTEGDYIALMSANVKAIVAALAGSP